MHALRNVLLVVVVLFAASAAGCRRDRCVPVCDQRAKEMGCHPQDLCKATCEKLHAAPTCKKELKGFEDCFLARPLPDWECDVDGTPVVKQDVCEDARREVIACLQNQATGSPPAH